MLLKSINQSINLANYFTNPKIEMFVLIRWLDGSRRSVVANLLDSNITESLFTKTNERNVNIIQHTYTRFFLLFEVSESLLVRYNVKHFCPYFKNSFHSSNLALNLGNKIKSRRPNVTYKICKENKSALIDTVNVDFLWRQIDFQPKETCMSSKRRQLDFEGAEIRETWCNFRRHVTRENAWLVLTV